MSQLPRLSIDKFKTQNKFYSKTTRTVSQSCQFKTLQTPVSVFPLEINIKDFQINKSYQNIITVKNQSQFARRFRISQPKTSKFKCDYDIQGSIAAGLQMKFYITFESNQLVACHDYLKITSEDDFSYELQMHAIPPQTQIEYETFINFGFIKKDNEAQYVLKVKNNGKINSKLEVATEGLPLSLRIPQNYLNLPQNCEKGFLLCYVPTSFGVFKHQIVVKIDGVPSQQLIELNGTCVDYQRFVVDQSGQQASLINFGSFFFGQKSTVESQLFNNSPIGVNYKALIIKGNLSKDSEKQVFSPQELGQQQTQKILQIIPNQGFIKPFTQIPIQIIFDTQISDQVQQMTRDFAYSQQEQKLISQDYQYTVIFEFQSKDQQPQDQLMLGVNGKAETPNIKISENILNFGTCKLNEQKDLILNISNLSQDKSIDIQFMKIPFIYNKPEKFTMKQDSIKNIIISFMPQKLGKINKVQYVCLIDSKYKIPIQIVGNCVGLQKARNNSQQFNFADNNRNEYILSLSNTMTFKSQTFHSEIKDINLIKKENTEQANQFLLTQKEKKRKTLQKKRYDSLCNNYRQPEKNDDENNDPPYDYEFNHGNKQLIQETLFVPEKRKDNLFVNKPIQGYEVTGNFTDENLFNPDPNQKIRKKFSSIPKSHAESKDCQMDLTGDMLKKIFTGPKLIDFGNIFIKSVAEKTFHVRNDLHTSISIKIQIQNDELSQSYCQTQIIPANKCGGFEIIFSSKIKQEFKDFIKYTINDKYEFIFQVQASVQPVKLQLQKDMIRLHFHDDSQELFTTETQRIFNNGNSNANFQWLMQENSIFSVKPQQDVIKPGQFQDCVVMYYPKGNATGKTEEEKITLQVEDGINQTIKCVGIVSDSKCQILEKEVNLGCIPVCTKGEGIITIKNLQKMPAIFNVSEKLPTYTEVSPMQGKLGPDQSLPIKVFFYSKVPVTVNNEIIIQLRGGKEHQIPFSVTTQIPQLSIKEDSFDFGSITTLEEQGSKISKNYFLNLNFIKFQKQFNLVTIKNSSNVPGRLLLDLRTDINKENDGLDCLEVLPLQSGPMEDESDIMKSIDDENDIYEQLYGNEIIQKDQVNEISENSNDENSFISDRSSKLYIITVKENKTLQFTINFLPKDVRDYHLVLPLTLLGFGKLPQLQKVITCIGIKPKFIMRPNVIEFKKKIVMQQQEKCFPSFQDLLITNPENRLLSWNIDAQSLNQEKLFQINPTSGRIDGGQSSVIKVSFNPIYQDKFEAKVPLYLDNNYKQPYSIIKMSGTGSFPKLYFDRREIIMPTVPLNVESQSEFFIINDGYESLILRHNVCIEYGNIELQVNYCNGNQIGIQNPKLRIELKFLSQKPISFTAKLEFYDENQRNYILMVSGTSDNSLLTNYQYIQRSQGEFQIIDNDQKPLILQPLVTEAPDLEYEDQNNISKSQKSFKSVLGYNPIPPIMMERNLETIKNWINQNILPNTQSIANYPGDLIRNNGSQIFDLLHYLTNKNLQFKAKIDQNMKKPQKVLELIKQYEDIITYLKENGGLLNSIRPHYFLSYQDFQCYLQITQNDFQSSVLRIKESKFQYISNDSWIQLYYQIIKIFFIVKINRNMIKNIPNINNLQNYQIMPDNYLQHSNLYSEQEIILMRWLEINYQIVFEKSIRLTNLDQDLKNCLHYIAVIKNYVGKSCQKYLSLIKKICVSDEDYINNAEKLQQMLIESGIITHFQKKDLINASSREILLFLFQLIQALPHYVPKGNPIIFSCVLGDEIIKEIELINSSNKEINYWVSYDGSNDFSIKNAGNLEYDTVKLEPKSRFQYKVKFTSRLSQSVEGRLTFTSKKDGNVQASALVFELKSNITSRKSIEFWNTTTKLYQSVDYQINLTNMFGQTGNFQINVVNITEEEEKPKENNLKKSKKKENIKNQENQNDMSIPGAFFCSQKDIIIRKGDVKQLIIQFMPFKLGTFKCHVILVDKDVGEFQHEIQGVCETPEQLEEYKIPLQIYVDQLVKYDFAIQFKNPLIQQLRKKHETRLSVKGKIQEKDDYLKLVQEFNMNEAIKYDIQIQPNNNQFVQVQNSIILMERHQVNRKQSIQNNRQSINIPEQKQNLLPLSFQFKNPVKDYSFYLIIKNQQLTDVRIQKIVLSVLPKPIKAQIDIKVPLGDEIKQEIPLINQSDRDVQFKIQLDGDNCFYGQKDAMVKKNSNGIYILHFKPQQTCTMEGKLTIINPYTSDTYEYQLNGFTEEPIAQDNIIINCKAGEQISHIIPIHNKSSNNITYQVETDLINPEGLKQITIQAHKTFNYNLKLLPVLGGSYTGSITFFDNNNKNNYIWFTVQMQIQRADPQRRIEIQTIVRKPVIVDIQIYNPESKDLNFDVIIQGESLQGEKSFYVPSKQTLTYELTYLPLKITQSIGLISFLNSKLGEIWYDLSLQAHPSPLIKLPMLQAEIGKLTVGEILLENPTAFDAQLKPVIQNTQNFQIKQKDFLLKAFSQLTVVYQYVPTQVNELQDGEINFTSNNIGDFSFYVSGNGLVPSQFEEKTIAGMLFKEIHNFIQFKNPYTNPININVSIEQEGDAFTLLGKTSNLYTQALSLNQIAFSFIPREIKSYSGCINISLNPNINWKYPIQGIAEMVVTNQTFTLQTNCKQLITQQFKFYLPGIPTDFGNEQLKLELGQISKQPSIYSQSLNIKPIKKTLENADDFLIYEFAFEPMKPFKQVLDLILMRKNGGQWKYKLFLTSLEPHIQDTIEINSELYKTTSVQIKITNKSKKRSKFKAYFQNEIQNDITVNPSSGEMLPSTAEAQQFVISFTPKEYKTVNAKLIIETDEHYWSFFVKGSFKNNNKHTQAQEKKEEKKEEKAGFFKFKQQSQN